MLNGNYISNSTEETVELGSKFAEGLEQGDIIALYGDLGAGKTEFIKGICIALNVEEIVNSPTFTITNRYSGTLDNKKIIILHIDLFRIKNLNQLYEIGFHEFINSDESLKLIEWAEKAEGILLQINHKIRIILSEKKEHERQIIIE